MVAVHSEEPSGCGGLSADVDIPPAGGDGRDGGDESRRIGKSDAKFSHPTGVTYEL